VGQGAFCDDAPPFASKMLVGGASRLKRRLTHPKSFLREIQAFWFRIPNSALIHVKRP
jgi:hypothetical protein